MKMKTMRSSILCFVVLLRSAPLLRAQDRREPANGSARRQAERQYVCLAIFLELAGVNPSAVYVSGKHSQKRSAKHGDHGCNEHSPVAAYARGAYQESASQSAANTHENVHNRSGCGLGRRKSFSGEWLRPDYRHSHWCWNPPARA